MNTRSFKDIFADEGLRRSKDKIIFRLHENSYQHLESVGNGGNDRISHVTYCVAPNAGDTVLSQCVRKTISSAIPTSGWDIIPVNKKVTREVIDTINRNRMLVIGGGGLFLPDTNKNSVSGWQWAVSHDLLYQVEVPICVYSVGYNYFRGQESNSLFVESLKDLVSKSSFFGLRNKGSIEAIRKLIPDESSSKIVYQPCTTTLIRKLFKDYLPEKKETGNVAINMAFDREVLRYGNNKNTILSQVARATKVIEEKGYRLFYVCHCWDDDKFLPYLKKCNVKYELVDLSRKFPPEVYSFYNNMDIVLGMRGHAQMIPFGLNCDIISLGTHDKLKWFLDDIDAGDWYIDLVKSDNNITEDIVEAFLRIHETDACLTKERLRKAQDLLWQITIDNLKVIMGVL